MICLFFRLLISLQSLNEFFPGQHISNCRLVPYKMNTLILLMFHFTSWDVFHSNYHLIHCFVNLWLSWDQGFIRFLAICGLRIQCSPHITFGNPHSLHPHIHIHAQIHINAHIHKYLYASMHKHMSMHTCTWTGLYTHIYIYTQTSHIKTHSYTYTHIYTYTSK